MLDDGMVATDEKIWRTNLSGKHRRGGAATCSVPPKSVGSFSRALTRMILWIHCRRICIA